MNLNLNMAHFFKRKIELDLWKVINCKAQSLCFIPYSASSNFMSAVENYFNLLQPTGHYMNHQLYILQLNAMATMN